MTAFWHGGRLTLDRQVSYNDELSNTVFLLLAYKKKYSCMQAEIINNYSPNHEFC